MGDVINNMGGKNWSINVDNQNFNRFDKNGDGKISLGDLKEFKETEFQVARDYIEESQMLNPEEKEFLNKMLDVMQKVKRISNEPKREILLEKFKNQKMQLGINDNLLHEMLLDMNRILEMMTIK